MKQEDIKNLLQEAVTPGCSIHRQSEIQVILSNAITHKNEGNPINNKAAGFSLILEELYVAYLKHKPEKLIELLPVFVVICGDRPSGSIIGDIDWSQI